MWRGRLGVADWICGLCRGVMLGGYVAFNLGCLHLLTRGERRS